MRNGGQLLVESLVALGAVRAFGVPGESYLAVLDALHDTQGKLDFVLCRNEGGAGFMAAAWGKLTGQPGICMVTRGPGATNASIGVHTAMQDSAPMILFVGHPIPHLRPDKLAALEALVNEHHPGLVPDQQLQPVRRSTLILHTNCEICGSNIPGTRYSAGFCMPVMAAADTVRTRSW